MEEHVGLLDRLAQLSGCICLSDLRSPAYLHQVLEALSQIDAEEYHAREWLEAASYLLSPLPEPLFGEDTGEVL